MSFQIIASGEASTFHSSKLAFVSRNTTTWTEPTTAILEAGNCIIYDERLNLWIMGTNFSESLIDLLSFSPQIQVSETGNSWDAIHSPADGCRVTRLCSGPDKIIALYFGASVMHIMTSSDALTWTPQTISDYSIRNDADICYSPDLDLYCIIEARRNSDAQAGVLISSDGESWEFHEIENSLPVSTVTWGAGLFVAMGSEFGSGEHLITSPDGEEWTIHFDDPAGIPCGWACVRFANDIFVAVSDDDSTDPGQQVAISVDGLDWEIVDTPVANWSCITHVEGNIWAAGANNTYGPQPVMVSYNNALSWFLIPEQGDFGFITGIAAKRTTDDFGNLWDDMVQHLGNSFF